MSLLVGAGVGTIGTITGGAKKKGGVENSVKCANEQMQTLEKGNKQQLAATVAVGGATLAAMKSKAVNNIAQKALNNAKDAFKNFKNGEAFKKAAPALEKLAEKVKSMPASTKAIAAAGLVLAGAVGSVIRHNTSYKAGQIDQKYTDKAAVAKDVTDAIK